MSRDFFLVFEKVPVKGEISIFDKETFSNSPKTSRKLAKQEEKEFYTKKTLKELSIS